MILYRQWRKRREQRANRIDVTRSKERANSLLGEPRMDDTWVLPGNGYQHLLSAEREGSEEDMSDMPGTEPMPKLGDGNPIRDIRGNESDGKVPPIRENRSARIPPQQIPSDILLALFADAIAGLIAYGGEDGLDLAIQLKTAYYKWVAYTRATTQ